MAGELWDKAGCRMRRLTVQEDEVAYHFDIIRNAYVKIHYLYDESPSFLRLPIKKRSNIRVR